MSETGAVTWRQLLKRHRKDFASWITAMRRDEVALSVIASQLGEFIVDRIERVRHEWPEAPQEFWDRIPDVRSCCSDPTTFTKPFAVEAYAYVHFLERYRRTWATLARLTQLRLLPLGSTGVRVLDIGTGPACALYAIEDFYSVLTEFATESQIPELILPAPQLACVENSQPMAWFFHEFSERTGRRGPFGAIADDFSTLDLSEKRRQYRSQNEYEEYWDEETGQLEEIYDPVSADAEAEQLFRYRLVVMSNFLTARAEVEHYRDQLLALFSDLKAGGVALVLGGTGDEYQAIYRRLAGLARESGLRDPIWHIDRTTLLDKTDTAARTIKTAQHRIYQYLADASGPEHLSREAGWPDYWNPEPSRKARPKFAWRVFRSGRWPMSRLRTLPRRQ